jgi:hypothetical protein
MDKNTKKLPLPTWCFVVLGMPTFYMPLAYFSLCLSVMAGMMWDGIDVPPQWLANHGQAALGVTFAMWPVYIAWVGFSRRLTWKEKLWWLFIILLLNMVGMPMFYVFMVRRYLGLEGRTGKRDELSLDRFLKRHSVLREKLCPEQLSVLRSYCRDRRLARWGVVPMIVLAALMLYTATVFIPNSALRIFSDSAPTRTVIIDSVAETTERIEPDPETEKLHVQIVMMFGVMSGVFGVGSLIVLASAIVLALGDGHSRTLVDFVKATGTEAHSDEASI